MLECVFPWKPGLPKCFKCVAIPCLVVIVQTFLTVVSLFIRVLGLHRKPKLESPEEECITLTCHASFLLSPVAEQRFQLLSSSTRCSPILLLPTKLSEVWSLEVCHSLQLNIAFFFFFFFFFFLLSESVRFCFSLIVYPRKGITVVPNVFFFFHNFLYLSVSAQGWKIRSQS